MLAKVVKCAWLSQPLKNRPLTISVVDRPMYADISQKALATPSTAAMPSLRVGRGIGTSRSARHEPQGEQREQQGGEEQSHAGRRDGHRARPREHDRDDAEQDHSGDDRALGQRPAPRGQQHEHHRDGDEADRGHQPQRGDRRDRGRRQCDEVSVHGHRSNCMRTSTGADCTALTVAVESAISMPPCGTGVQPGGAVTCTVRVDAFHRDCGSAWSRYVELPRPCSRRTCRPAAGTRWTPRSGRPATSSPRRGSSDGRTRHPPIRRRAAGGS